MKRLVVCMFLVACTDQRAAPTERPADEKVALGGSVAARVGGTPIPVSLVAAVANAQKVTAREAARRVIDDEIAAQAARTKGLDQRDPTSWDLTSARARMMANRFRAEAIAKGPPTDEEVKGFSERNWAEVDRPETYDAMHALVFFPKDPKKLPEARALAERMHDAVAGATSDADFEAKAKAVPVPKPLQVRVEPVGTFREDGRSIGGGGIDDAFSKAAAALPTVGATSGIVETSFGFHVIRLVAKYPPMRMAFEDRRAAATDDVIAARAHESMSNVLQARARSEKITIEPAAESLMREVKIEPPSEQALLP